MLACPCDSRFCFALPLLAALTGCASFSPPVRSTHRGSPGRLKAGDVEIMGASNVYGSGGPTVSVAVIDELAIEAGGEFLARDKGWAVGHAGVRGTLNGRERGEHGELTDGFAGDIAVAAGAGTSDEGGLSGAVGDAGLSGHVNEYFAWWFRASGQYTKAERAPGTLWWAVMTGPEATVGPASFYVGGAIAGMAHVREQNVGPLLELGLSLHFSAFADPLAESPVGQPRRTTPR